MTKYIGISFDTANHDRASVCRVTVSTAHTGVTQSGVRPHNDYIHDFSNERVHGISMSDVSWSPEFDIVFRDTILSELKDASLRGHEVVFTSYNASYDFGVMRAACEKYGIPMPTNKWLCALRTARREWPDAPNYKLETIRQLQEGEKGILISAGDSRATAARRIAEQVGFLLEDEYLPNLPMSFSGLATVGDIENPAKFVTAEAVNVFRGRSVVFTGPIRGGLVRARAQAFVNAAGGVVHSAVTSSTMILVDSEESNRVNFGSTEKERRFKQNMDRGSGAYILPDNEFLSLFGLV